MKPAVTVEHHTKTTVLTIDNPPANTINARLRRDLWSALDAVEAHGETERVLLRADGRTFLSGADFTEFARPLEIPTPHDVLGRIASFHLPITALLDGTVLGGGLELALACRTRLATPAAKLGFPEVSLGIIPGGGGTQRLPRLIELNVAIEMLVDGLFVDGARAAQLGLVDRLIDGNAPEAALAATESLPPPVKVAPGPITPSEPALKQLELTRSRIQRDHAGFMAPLRAIDAIELCFDLDLASGLVREWSICSECMTSAEARALQFLFFAERRVAKAVLAAKPIFTIKADKADPQRKVLEAIEAGDVVLKRLYDATAPCLPARAEEARAWASRIEPIAARLLDESAADVDELVLGIVHGLRFPAHYLHFIESLRI